MGERTNAVSDTQSQDVEVIRDDIERTRDDMSQTIDEIQERLSPDTLKHQAQDSVQEITDQVLGEVRTKAADLTSSLTDQINAAVHSATAAKTDQMLTQASDTARQVGASLWERMGQNPTPIALAALGIGVAASQVLRGGNEDQSVPGAPTRSGGLTDKVSGTAGTAQNVASDALDSALHGTSQTLDQAQASFEGMKTSLPSMPGSIQGFLSEQPLAAGAVALGLGLVVGLGLPETQNERQAMEPVRQRVQEGVAQATGSTQGLVEQAKEAASKLATEAKDAASGTVADAKSAAKDVGETAKQAGKQAASDRGLTT